MKLRASGIKKELVSLVSDGHLTRAGSPELAHLVIAAYTPLFIAMFYIHANFKGNPHKQGIINITDAPSLPIRQRQKQQQAKPPKPVVAPTNADINLWATDKRLVQLSSPDHDLTDKERLEWERGVRQFQEVVSQDNPFYRYHHNRVLKHRT